MVIASLCNFVTVTVIAARLCIYRDLVQQAVGNETEHNSPYESALIILVESAGLYGVLSVAFIVSYALESFVAKLVGPTLCNVRVSVALLR